MMRVVLGDLNADTFTVSGPEEIYGLLDKLARVVLVDSKCGDGICDENEYE